MEDIMLKGVNKTIIEVNNPDSIYFEKAVFYLRPHVRTLPEEIKADEISQYIAQIGPSCDRGRKRKLFILLAALAVTAAAVILFLILR